MEQSVSAGGKPMLVVRRSSFGCLDRALAGVCVAGEHQSEVSLLQGERSSMAPPVAHWSTQRRTTSSSSQPGHRLTGVLVFVAA